MARDEGCRVRVFAITERVGFPRIGELVCISAGVPIENAPDGVIARDVRVKGSTIVVSFWWGGTGSGSRRWSQRACDHTSRGNIGPRWGPGGRGG